MGAPSGVSGSFSPNPATQSSLLTLTVASGAPAGSYTLTVRGTAGSLTREARLDLVVTATPPPPPPPATIYGTYVFGLYIDQDGNLDETKSTYIRILREGRSAPYTLRNLAPGTYLVAAWKDVNGNEEVDQGDYLGIYADAQGNYLVSPPKCPRFGFATWNAQVGAGGGLFWGPHGGESRGGVLKYPRIDFATPLAPSAL